MNRFFTGEIAFGKARITGEDVRHIVRVLRLRPGDAVTLCDGLGTDYDGVIDALDDDNVYLNVGEGHPAQTESPCRITLFQCLPKTGKMETIVQKCTELGVCALVPVVSDRCVAQPGGNYENKRVRYQRVAQEAAKQSRRGIIPAVGLLTPLSGIDPGAFDLFLVAYEEEQAFSLRRVLRQNYSAKRVAVLIGPEGGLTPEEVSLLVGRGALSVSLGKRILRTETAGMAMLAQILYELDP